MLETKINSPYLQSLAKKKLYWMLQLSGWLGMMFIEMFNFTFFIAGEFQWRYFYFFGIYPFFGILSSHGYKQYFIPKSVFEQGLGKVWSKALLDVVVISLIIVLLGRLFSLFGQYSILKVPISETLRVMGPQFMNVARYVVVWIIIYYLYHILQRNNELQRANLEAKNQAKIAELELLKTQLNPHFLFQSLSSIKSMVIQDKELARDGIISLSELLRYSLNYDKNSVVSVQEELLELNKYIALEKLRLGTRIQFSIDIEDTVLDQKLPAAALLNMLENVIRNGEQNHEDEIIIKLLGYSKFGKITFELTGNQVLLQQHVPLTKGMENLEIRLQKLYGPLAELTIGGGEAEHFLSKLTLPGTN